MTFPKTTSSIRSLGTPLRAIAASAAATARSVAVRSAKTPPKLPNGVRAPERSTTSFSFTMPTLQRWASAALAGDRYGTPKSWPDAYEQGRRDHDRCPLAAPGEAHRTNSRRLRQAYAQRDPRNHRGERTARAAKRALATEARKV